MVGVGRFSSPTRPTSRSRLITKRIAWAATFPQKRMIGFTSEAIPFSIQSKKGKYPRRPASAAWFYWEVTKLQKKQYLAATLTGIAVIGASVALFRTKPVAAQTERSAAVFTSDGKLELPVG
jgi:hypothetical protein